MSRTDVITFVIFCTLPPLPCKPLTVSPSSPSSAATTPAAPRQWTVADFDFELPPDLIAQAPAAERSASRLLDAGPAGGDAAPVDRIFRELPHLLEPGDLLVFNDTQVIRARLYGAKDSGGAVEALVERVLAAADGAHSLEVWAHLRASKSPRAGQAVQFRNDAGESFRAEVLGRCGPENGLFHLRFPGDAFSLLERFGHVPLPPYITHADTAEDARRYQTVFARHPGAVAAPTAALHFDEALLAALDARGVQRAAVTLHVGAGTFQPVRAERLEDHRMHSEWFEVPQATVDAIHATRAAGGRIVAVGTTSLRALESAGRAAAQAGSDDPLLAGARETDIFITPGFEFRVVDRLVTNFHLPRSTLMMLVSAFAGCERIRQLYDHAIAQRYRFFSYGDAMLLSRR